MLHAVVLLAGLGGLFLALAGQQPDAQMLAVAGVSALLCVAWTARLGGLDAESVPYFRFVRLAPLLVARTQATIAGATRAARAAVRADITLKPELVRLRLRAQGDAARAAFAHLVNATPGEVVIDIDDDGLLMHTLDEDAVEDAQLAALEGQVVRALEGRAQ
jgi:multisubunit Na+/H+ antiporter MnhE subunit